jgi:menaquinone-dependent protoporphyrinogen oxidase
LPGARAENTEVNPRLAPPVRGFFRSAAAAWRFFPPVSAALSALPDVPPTCVSGTVVADSRGIMATTVLVIYGTTNGQTGQVAAFVSETLRKAGAYVTKVDAAGAGPLPSPGSYDAVIVAASVHAGGYQRAVRRWVQANAAALSTKPSAFVSVCLGVLQHDPDVDRELGRIRERFFTASGWHPAIVKIVAGALPYTKYNWFTRWMMRRIVSKTNGDTDTSRDYEYTDWPDLERFALDFLRQAAGVPAHAAAS